METKNADITFTDTFKEYISSINNIIYMANKRPGDCEPIYDEDGNLIYSGEDTSYDNENENSDTSRYIAACILILVATLLFLLATTIHICKKVKNFLYEKYKKFQQKKGNNENE